MNLLIGLIPALGWGIMPLIATKAGGDHINQIVGTTYATLITAIVIYLISQPQISWQLLLMGMLSGACWATGQMLQYQLFQKMTVSKAMPISTGLQIIGTALIGVLVFGEWAETSVKIIGTLAIIGIIFGMYFTTIRSKSQAAGEQRFSTASLIITFIVSTLGYLGYNIFPQLVGADPWAGFLPQGIGMALMSTIFALYRAHKTPAAKNYFTESATWRNLASGFFFALAALFYIVSARRNGVATGFALTQMSVVISTIGGILLLHEHKTKKELTFTIIGLALVMVGGITIGIM
ncbi:GRP family sugar transporter [Lapidilactobacillus luobeiensis]|uniref:GRP family sugar transporter n=1 Tax=Lapidilactobacillus luobeiensis TaxID=2950371 RepID=UPI0021C2B2A4|nr:GRP family sugar transporter [Lapidilactobacillus luobeiensis]